MAAAVTAVQQTQKQQNLSQNIDQQQQQQLRQYGNSTERERCVLVSRQHDGFGLTISGDYPVFVNSVKADGAAFKAGVREGDRVLKVNGMPVTGSNFQEVLRMISGYFLKLNCFFF